MVEAKIVLDSIAPNGRRLITWRLTYWRSIHSEFMTHTLFSRNAASSRARPLSSVRKGVQENPALPISWGENQKGMSPGGEITGAKLKQIQHLWNAHRNLSLDIHRQLEDLGLHKSVANRLLEAHDHITVVMTSTDRSNFYWQRLDEAADANIQALAHEMWEAQRKSKPHGLTPEGGWHLPFVNYEESFDDIEHQKQLSVSRCAAVSYLRQDKHEKAADLARYDKLLAGRIKHWSPFQHQGQAMGANDGDKWSGNFQGWTQLRKTFAGERHEGFEPE